MSIHASRIADHPVDPMFLQRWSPRAFTGESISEAELMTLFEAARWAPSAGNSQPWRFIYARRETAAWQRFLGLLEEANRVWAHRAAALVIVLSKKSVQRPGRAEPKPLYSHSFDTGSAWAMLALQALRSGWHTHPMLGFDIPRTIAELRIPDDHHVEAAVAIGRRGDKSVLSDSQQEHEIPSGREPLANLVIEGEFPEAWGRSLV